MVSGDGTAPCTADCSRPARRRFMSNSRRRSTCSTSSSPESHPPPRPPATTPIVSWRCCQRTKTLLGA